MTTPFHTRIRAALADPDLQAALDGNAERRLTARTQAFQSLPEDLDVLRRRAHTVRAETIARLDHYLEQFVSRVTANGIQVHTAGSAADAVRTVLDISRSKGASLIAKSKTMVSEEIELNHALEAAGLRVVETDLGEYIVQLRNERPAHIITPAVHLRRAQVGQTFHEKLGLPFTEDIPALTAAARSQLRETFLSAGIGLSGVNFGVAETGTLCLVTNEGNGRMVTTLPPVHIALMGIERLVPALDDLALMLYLLPRHATGQKLTVYTSLINSPRRPDDPDGPQERHLILVDNGRSALRGTPLAEALLCIRCGACLNACPVFREIGGHAYVGSSGQGSTYPGPIGSVVSPALFGQPEFAHLARASSLCGACKDACPVDIDLPKLLLRVRAGGVHLETRRTPRNVPPVLALALRVFTWIATRPGIFAAAQRFAGRASRLLSPASGWLRLPAVTGWGYSKDFPRPAARPFRDRWASGQLRSRPDVSPAPANSTGPASLHAPAAEVDLGAEKTAALELQERFALELAALGGTFYACREADLPARVLDLLRQHRASRVHAWEDGRLPAGLLSALAGAGIEITHAADPDVPVGLTGALAAVAETGTLVLPSGAGQPLSASLLPPVHIAVFHSQDLYENLPQVLHLKEVRESASTALVSGPSRTADIEMTLTIGVHGPGELHVFCLDEAA